MSTLRGITQAICIFASGVAMACFISGHVPGLVLWGGAGAVSGLLGFAKAGGPA